MIVYQIIITCTGEEDEQIVMGIKENHIDKWCDFIKGEDLFT